MGSDEAEARRQAALAAAVAAPREVFVVYADVSGVEGGPVVLPGFEAPSADLASATLRTSTNMYRRELESMGIFSEEQIAGAKFRLKDVE